MNKKIVIAAAIAGILSVSGCKVSVADLAPASIPTPTGILAKPVVVKFDDCDDGDNVNNWAGYWFTYDDTKAPNFGSSKVYPRNGETFYMTAIGPDWPGGFGNNIFGARMWGQVINDGSFAYPFIGVGSGLSPNEEPQDITNFDGIRMWVKRGGTTGNGSLSGTDSGGNVKRFRIAFKHANVSDPSTEDYYGYTFDINNPDEWTYMDIPFTLFAQQSWSSPLDKTQSFMQVQGIQFQTKNNDPGAGTILPVDVWIDNIVLYRD